MDYNRLCMGCMEEFDENEKVCPHCGYVRDTPIDNVNGLEPFTVLNGQYLVGRSIGEGGFGITYLAYDLNNNCKVAIKEYFPSGLVSRDKTLVTGPTIKVEGQKTIDIYQKGLERFTNEALILKKYNTLPGIVSVKQLFQENGTAYMVMEYIEGVTLSKYLESKSGKSSEQEVLSIMRPVMDALVLLHKDGIIHRDISPDNIMLTKSNTVKLIDFGAARYFQGEENKSLTIILKRGYAPTEQYQSRGKQGAWTDVYAMAGVIYRMITGIVPPESIARLSNSETLISPSDLHMEISPYVEQALLKGLAIAPEDRYQTIWDLKNALYENVQKKQNDIQNNSSEKEGNYKSGKNKKVIAIIACIVALCIVVLVWQLAIRGNQNNKEDVVEAEKVEVIDETEQNEEVANVPIPENTEEADTTLTEVETVPEETATPEATAPIADTYVSDVDSAMWLDFTGMANTNYSGYVTIPNNLKSTERNGYTYLVPKEGKELVMFDSNGQVVKKYSIPSDKDYDISGIYVLEDGRTVMNMSNLTSGTTIWVLDKEMKKVIELPEFLGMPKPEFMSDYRVISVDDEYIYFVYNPMMSDAAGLYRAELNLSKKEKVELQELCSPFYAIHGEVFYILNDEVIRMNIEKNTSTMLCRMENSYSSPQTFQFTKDYVYIVFGMSDPSRYELWKIAVDGSNSNKIYESETSIDFYTYNDKCFIYSNELFPIRMDDLWGEKRTIEMTEVDMDTLQEQSTSLDECITQCPGCWSTYENYIWKTRVYNREEEVSNEQK